MELTRLELRSTPSRPSFDFAYNSSTKEDWEAFGADNGGGPRVQVFHQGSLVFDQFVFEPTFRGGVDVSWSGDNLVVGAGAGGGPRVKILDVQGGEPLKDYFAFDPASREGILVLHGVPSLGYRDKHEVAPILTAQGYSGYEGFTTYVQWQINKIPLSQQRLIRDAGIQVLVHNQRSVTDLPEFSHLRGVKTVEGGDEDRTWDDIPALATTKRAILSESSARATIHEIGHTIHLSILNPTDPVWNEIWSLVDEPSAYEETNRLEAFAEAYVREVKNTPNHPLVSAYLRERLPWR